MFAGNIIALIMSLVLALFYLTNRRLVITRSKYYPHSLLFLAASSLLGIAADALLSHAAHLYALCIFVLSVYYICSFLAFAYACLYLVSRILSNAKTSNYLKQSNLVVLFLGCVYLMLLLLNIPMGILFTLEGGVFVRGPLFSWDVVTDAVSLSLVLICCIRKRRFISRSLYVTLAQLFTVLTLCTVLSALLASTRLSSLMLSLVHLVLYLNFRRIYVGEHALATLSDRRGFVMDTDFSFARNTAMTLFLIRLQNTDMLKKQYGATLFYEMLYRFAIKLSGCVEYAHAYHVSDDDFVLCVPSSKKQSKDEVCGAVQLFAARGVMLGELEVKPECTVVEYTSPTSLRDAAAVYESMRSAADYALETALGYVSYFDTYAPAVQERTQMNELVRSIDREHGYTLALHPIRENGRSVLELLRARVRLSTDGGEMDAEELLRAISEAGKSHALTFFLLEEVCRMMAENPALSQLTVLIDLPFLQLADGELLHRFNEITARYRISHERIVFAISEQITLLGKEQMRAAVCTISGMGYGFDIVGFGAEGTALNVLRSLPIRRVWLAQSLVSQLGEGAISHLILLLRESGFTVALEEENETLPESLRVDFACQSALASAMTVEELLAFLNEKK